MSRDPTASRRILLAVALSIDPSRPARSRAARQALIEAVRDAPASEQETNWLEWKGRLDLSDKATHAMLAKAVLGFANREPDRAAIALGGTAYLLVGVEPGSVTGVQPVDLAALEPQVVAYTGTGPQWSGDYIEIDGQPVLVVTVEAPEWGDPIHPVRKAFLPPSRGQALALAAIYVRKAAASEVARPADIDSLSRRARGKPQEDDRLVVDIRQADGPGPGRVDLSEVALDGFLDSERARLLRPLRSQSRPASFSTFDRLTGDEYREPEEYKVEVDKYVEKLTQALPEVLQARSVMHEVGALSVEVENPTNRPFNKVEVRVRLLDPALTVIVDKSDANHDDETLPTAPRLWGTRPAPRDYGFAGFAFRPVSLHDAWAPTVVEQSDAVELVFRPRDVRPHTSTRLGTVWLLLSNDDLDELGASWTATSTNARGQAHGSLTVRLDGRLWSPTELLADAPDSD